MAPQTVNFGVAGIDAGDPQRGLKAGMDHNVIPRAVGEVTADSRARS